MRNQFAWYFPLTDKDLDDIWNEAILTVDANVLLDLYRVNIKTRDTLIKSIESFSNRVWLSHQSAYEYIKNINKVKISAESAISSIEHDIEDQQNKFCNFLDSINSKKIFDKDIIDGFKVEILDVFKKIKEHSDSVKEKHIKELNSDYILEWVAKTFDNAVGSDIPAEQRKNWEEEAKRRIENKIPPGYLDKDKDTNSSGDIFVWKQILERAKEASKTVIFVTSEQKEDWWEKHSGKTVGQRFELLKEAHDVCGQKIIIWKTGHFLEMCGKRRGKGRIDAKTAAAIKEFSELPTIRMSRIRIVQNHLVADERSNSGIVSAYPLSSVKKLRVRIDFDPRLICAPDVKIRLKSHMPIKDDIIITPIRSSRFYYLFYASLPNGEYFVPSKYLFYYNASCNKDCDFSVDDSKADFFDNNGDNAIFDTGGRKTQIVIEHDD